MTKSRLPTLGFLALLLAAGASEAQNCFDDTRFDDGTFENAIGAVVPSMAHFVMRLDPPAVSTFDRLCLCWVTNNPAADVTFDLVVWDADGPQGAPETLLRRFEDLEARGVPAHNPGGFYTYDLTAAQLTVTGPVYVGPVWDAARFPGFFLCSDYNGPSTQPGYYDISPGAGTTPPLRPLGAAPPFQDWVALGLRAVFTELPGSLHNAAELILPGYGADLRDPNGRTTLFGLRNTGAEPLAFEIEYHGNRLTAAPRRVDAVELAGAQSRTFDVRDDPTGLDPDADGFAAGLALVRRGGAGTLPLEGEYFQVDFTNDFATGERLVRPEDFCDLREIRFFDFGSGTQLRILIDLPRGDESASFTYEVYDQPGSKVASGEVVTADHLSVVDLAQLAPPDVRFGTVVFDFTAAGGGWVSATYSAFGKFSAELSSACRD